MDDLNSTITQLSTALSDAKQAVEARGGTVGDTGLAGLAEEIDTIPSGGSSTPQFPSAVDGLSIVYYTEPIIDYVAKTVSSGCTVNSIDSDTLDAYLEEHEVMDWILFLYERGLWHYESDWEMENWMTTAEFIERTGIDVTLDEGATFADIEIEQVRMPDRTSERKALAINLDVDLSNLCSFSSTKSTATIECAHWDNENSTWEPVTLYPFQIVGVAFGPDFGNHECSNLLNYTSLEFIDFSGWDIEGGEFTIGDNWFTNLLDNLQYPVVIPDTVTSIGNYFLYYCESFNQPITIPDTVTSIGDSFLSRCSSFNQPITIPDTVTSIGSDFLSYCTSLNQPLTLNSVTSIGNYFLAQCRDFNQSLTIPDTVTSIGSGFLAYCNSFNQPIIIPSSVTTIGGSFLCCFSLTSQISIETTYVPASNLLIFAPPSASAPAYTQGMNVAVPSSTLSTWQSRFPDTTSSPYRKVNWSTID